MLAAAEMIMAVKEDCGKIGGPQECAGCGKKIHDKYLLKVNHALNIYYISIKKEKIESYIIFFCEFFLKDIHFH